ncbi:MAG: glycosidase, partial [Chloroflexota bacterium]|nr:glycosidase [Chloroflexota bacterium]
MQVAEITELPFRIQRLGVVMEEDPVDPNEAWGVLNPACARSRSGELYLYPRVVADGNYSRVGLARVLFDRHGDPTGVERLGYALEPVMSYERNPRTAGCEDPRVTFVAALDTYVMTYTAYGPYGPRVGLAVSADALTWRRIGLTKFETALGVDFDFYYNKDALIFPELVQDPDGRPSVALIHRPDYELSLAGAANYHVLPEGVTDSRPSMWISYCPVHRLESDLTGLNHFGDHHLLATPEGPWQALKIGGGTPPVLTQHGWLTLFHGVAGQLLHGVDLQPNVHYSAGAMILDRTDPRKVLYRSESPVLQPVTEDEREGLVDNVVFPTAVDPREGGRI